MKAEELITKNLLGMQNLPDMLKPNGTVQKVVFEEIALAAVKMARIEATEKAIEEFTRFVDTYCREAGHREISKDAEYYIKAFKKQLKVKQ